MDRAKSSSSRGAKSKITQYPPDIFALGSKPSTSKDELKRPSSTNKPSSKVSKQQKSAPVLDRKREHSNLTTPVPPKKTKISAPVIRAVPSTSTDKSDQKIEFWETIAVDFDSYDLVKLVVNAYDNNDIDKVNSLICGAVKQLKLQRYKPCRVIYYSLIYLCKLYPPLFLSESITNALASLLRRNIGETAAHSLKSKGSPSVQVLSANLLLKTYLTERNWPELFVKLYVEDALGDRIWVDNEECKPFIDNITTAFNTRVPPKSLLTPELTGALGPRDTTSSPVPPSIDEDIREGRSTPEIGAEVPIDVPVLQRYSQSYEQVEQIVLEAIKEQLNRRQAPETITRNFLRLLSSTCGLVEIRMIAVSRLEIWLHNPKLMRPAQELLAFLCCNCSGITQRDLEVLGQLTKIRLKTKALVNVYLNCLRELVSVHSENLPHLLKHTIYNELSNARNPNNMPMISVFFSSNPEISASTLAEIFQDLLINKDDYLRSLRALLREIVRVLRFDINLLTLCKNLVKERKDLTSNIRDFEFKERVFQQTADLLTLAMFLGISPQVKEAAQLAQRGDKKEIATLQAYQLTVAKIQRETVFWLHDHVLRLYRPQIQDYVHILHKIFFLEPLEQYYKIDMWPSESERGLLYRLASEVPLLEDTLVKLLTIGLSKEHPLCPNDCLELCDQLIKRAAGLPSEGVPPLQTDKLEIIDFIFNLATYHHPENMTLPSGYTPPNLAISNLYWKSWIMLLMLSAHNPSTFGSVAWKKYPMLRTFIEMCITNHFSYPPPTVAMGEVFEDLKNKELQICALEKQQILEFESHLAALSTKIAITEQNSLLISQLMEMKPLGDARQPTSQILDQIHSLNNTHRMGHLLCRSRHPDFLLDIIQRQGSTQHMPWLADLVHNSDGALSHLPVQCLCEYLLIGTPDTLKHKKHFQVLNHLQNLLSESCVDVTGAFEVLEYFLRRLTALLGPTRNQAIRGLKLILESDSDDKWLEKVSNLPHFVHLRPLVVSSLRQACQVETEPSNISQYIYFLSEHTKQDSLPEMTELVLDLSQLIVERATITSAILPVPETVSKQALKTLSALVRMFSDFLNKSKEPRQDTIPWSESQEQILIQWQNSEECTMHILVVHAMIILLTYGPGNDPELFSSLLETWFPENGDPPKAFLVDTSEEALLIPDWLKLRLIRSSVPRLVDAALVNLEPPQLVLFIQSFGIPVPSMSKLLGMLDQAVTVHQASVGESVLDKCYMAQLVEVQHRRGALGGGVFVQVLQLQEPKLPEDNIIISDVIREIFPTNLNKIDRNLINFNSTLSLLNSIFLKSNFDGSIDSHFSSLLRNLSREINSKKAPKKLLKALLEYFISSLNSSKFIYSVIREQTYSSSIFRLICSSNTYPEQILVLSQSLLGQIGDKKCPLAQILSQYVRKQKKSNPTQICGSENVLEVLGQSSLVTLERKTKTLVEKSLESSKSDFLVESLCRLLMSDVRSNNFNRTGLLVDWIAELEMEIISSVPDLEMELLFSKNELILNKKTSFRPYLLTLLTHRVSWRALSGCVLILLSQTALKRFEPGLVLDFLWALTCNPKLWQGRDKFTPKNYRLENVLHLKIDQVLILVDYMLLEAENLNNFELSIQKIEERLPLLMQSIQNATIMDTIVIHLVQILEKRAQNTENEVITIDICEFDPKVETAQQFLILLYMKMPTVVQKIPKNVKINSKITECSTSIIDKITHNLFTALAVSVRLKDWGKRVQEYELLARKMASTHPYLVLRQLNMISASLKGRTHLEFGLFKCRNHLNFFGHILGIIELLQPNIFELEYQNSLESILMEYFSVFKIYGSMKDLHSLLGKFVNLLQSYIAYDANRALKYLQQHARLLNDLHLTFTNLRPLRSLMASISLPKEENPLAETSEGGEILVAVPRAPSPEHLPQNWNALVTGFARLQDDELPSILQEIDHLSNRRYYSNILDRVVSLLCQIILSSSSQVRNSGHTLLLRYLKQRPGTDLGPNNPVVGAVLQALDSANADIVNGVLERLAEYVVCLQEYAPKILEKSFVLGIKSNINTSGSVSRAISVLNMQSSCR